MPKQGYKESHNRTTTVVKGGIIHSYPQEKELFKVTLGKSNYQAEKALKTNKETNTHTTTGQHRAKFHSETIHKQWAIVKDNLRQLNYSYGILI